MNFKQIFEKKARRLVEFAEDLSKNEGTKTKASIYYSKAIPLYCEAYILSKIYNDKDTADRCIQEAMDTVNRIQNSENNLANSVCHYARAINLVANKKFHECIKSLELARAAISDKSMKYMHDPLYKSWIHCEIAYCHKKQSDFDLSLRYYVFGYIMHKIFEIRNQHLGIIRRYLHHAILSESKFLDDVDFLDQLEKIADASENRIMSCVYYVELAILNDKRRDETHVSPVDKKLYVRKRDEFVDKAIKFANELNCTQSICHYVNGIKYIFEGKYHDAKSEIKQAENQLEENSIDDMIYSVFLSREKAFCEFRILETEQKNFNHKNTTNQNIKIRDLYLQSFKKIENLEWELDLHWRTLGLFYNFIGSLQFYRWVWDDKKQLMSDIKEISSQDPFFANEIKDIKSTEKEIIENELKLLNDPTFAFNKSLYYIEKVKDSDTVLKAFLHLNLSQAYSNVKKDNPTAQNELKKAFESIKDAERKQYDPYTLDYLRSQYHHAFAFIAQELKDYESAKSNYILALKFAKTGYQAFILNNLTKLMVDQNKFDEAIEFCRRGIEIGEKENLDIILPFLYCNLVTILVSRDKDFNKAKECLTKAKEKLSKVKEKSNEVGVIKLVEYVENKEKWISLIELTTETQKKFETSNYGVFKNE